MSWLICTTLKRPYARTVVFVVSTLASAAIVVLDRMTKLWAMARIPGDTQIIPGIVAITHHQNFGLIANLPVPREIILFVTSVVLLIVTYLCIRTLLQHKLVESIAFACVIGGAIGNLWDRYSFGYVFDWLLFFHRSILNIADIAIGAGIVLLLILMRRNEVDCDVDSH